MLQSSIKTGAAGFVMMRDLQRGANSFAICFAIIISYSLVTMILICRTARLCCVAGALANNFLLITKKEVERSTSAADSQKAAQI